MGARLGSASRCVVYTRLRSLQNDIEKKAYGTNRKLTTTDQICIHLDELKRSTPGKLATATQAQSAEYLRPFFKSLRQKALEPDVLMRITEIAELMIKREHMAASDAYLKLSIGNAPWPIGVTMVG